MVNTMQQVGGSVEAPLLSTLAASAAAAFARTHTWPPGLGVHMLSAVHGYTTAFTGSGGILAVGGAVTAHCCRPV